MALKIKVINDSQKDEIFYITISDKDRIIDIRKEIQKNSVYFSEMSFNRIGLFILIPKELLLEEEKDTNKSQKRRKNYFFDINENEKEKMKLSTKNDLKVLESYPYIKDNYKTIILYSYDLGMQINTPLANVIEYSAPIIILLFYSIKYNYLNNKELNNLQTWTITMLVFHYTKRVFESIYVHIQINTMEFKMFLLECLYYILYFGVYAQKKIFENIKDIENNEQYGFAFLFFFSEFNNYHCHVILRQIRLENNNNREIPKGNIFHLVYCANYFWEILSWLFLSLFCSIKAFYFFTFMGGVVMTLWALEKKEFYDKFLLKKYGIKNNKKKAIIPFII